MNIYKNKWVSWIIWRFILRNPKLRLQITKLLIKDENKEIEIAGSKLFVNTVSEIGYVRAARNSFSNVVFRDEIPSLINISLIIEPQDTFVDVGANIGLYSNVIGRLQYIYPNTPFYAFEANADTAKRLKITLKDKNTSINVIGISDQEGSITFIKGATSGVFGAIENISDFQNKNWKEEVNTKRLDSYDIKGNSIILKIDVEGHEWQVLQGALSFFRDQRVKAVYLDGYDDNRIPEFLREYGFEEYDGRTLQKQAKQNFSLLFLKRSWIEKNS